MSIGQFFGSAPDRDLWSSAAARSSLRAVAALLTLAGLSAPLMAQTTPTSAPASTSSATTTATTGTSTKSTLVAQASTTAPATDVAQAQTGTTTTAQGAESGEALQEVMVTAERVVSQEQRVPIAITEISGAQLTEQNIIASDQLKGLVPSLNIFTQGGGGAGSFGQNEMAVYVRGVGTSTRFFNNDTGVGVYLDDVYLADTQNLNLSFFDLSNIQVLEGPQGTLFGRNSFGGAVTLTTAPPTQDFGGYAQVRVGSYNRLDTQGAINMPFSDVLTTRFSFYTSNVDGYITHLLDSGTNDDIHEKTARYQVHFQPSSTFSADLMGEYGASDDDGNEEITISCNSSAHYVSDYNAVNNGGSSTGPNAYCTKYKPLGQRYEVYGNTVSKFPEPTYAYLGTATTENTGAAAIAGPSGLTSPGGRLPFDQGVMSTLSLRMAWIVNDDLTLKSITGLRRSDLDSYRDDGTPAGLYTELDDYWDEDYSQELQGLMKFWGGRLNIVAGLYYYLDSAASIQDTGPDYDDPVGYYYGNILSEHSWAAYGQGTLAVTDKFSIIGGIRNTHDTKTSSSDVFEQCWGGNYLSELNALNASPQGNTAGCWVPGPLMGNYATATHSWSHTDPRLQFQYQFTPDFMGYASADSGYESGGFNAQLPELEAPNLYNLPYQQETLWNYEAGIKTEWLNHRLRFNIDGFDEIFDNYQTSVTYYYYNGNVVSACPTGSGGATCIDVGTTSSGADAHERGVEFELDVIPIDNLTIQLNGATLSQGYDAVFLNAQSATLNTHAHLASAPSKQASVTANYTFHLANGGTVVPNVNWRFEGTQWGGTLPNVYLIPSYALFGANVAYNSPGNKYSISYWCTNCTNKYYYATYASPNIVATGIGIGQVTPGRPREMGLMFQVHF